VRGDSPTIAIAIAPQAGWKCFRYGNTLALLPMNGDRLSSV